MKRVFKGDLRRDTACESCGTAYFYFTEIEVKEGGETPFEQKINEAAEEAIDTVPCPECGKMTKAMWQHFWLVPVASIVGLALCLGGLYLMLVVMDGGVLLWGLGLVALGWAGMCVLSLLMWPFMILMGRSSALRPGREHEAHADAQAKYEAWRRIRQAEADL